MPGKAYNERYHRQLNLRGFGVAAQKLLLKAKVLVVGAGGLGCPVLQYLTAAGTGCIGIVDGDSVSATNLHRQVLYNTNDIGKAKVLVAAAKLRLMNPDTELIPYEIQLNQDNCLGLVEQYNIIVDCTDNFPTRYMLNDACVLKSKPFIYGAVNRFEGQVAVFNVPGEGKRYSGNYRDLFPVQPGAGEVQNCAEAGVLGVLPGIIGSIQANEAIKIITGIGTPLVNQLLTYNALDNKTSVFEYTATTASVQIIPQTEAAFLDMDYGEACIADAGEYSIDITEFDALIGKEGTKFIDLREAHELPFITEFEYMRIVLADLNNKWHELKEGSIVFFCQSGSRSQQAVMAATTYFSNPGRFFSLRGGISAWKKMHEK
jgi:sulfur-carrier protein adenylyltransferase/sulfurtransferase